MDLTAAYWAVTDPWCPLSHSEKVKCIKLMFVMLEHVEFILEMSKRIEKLKLFLGRNEVSPARDSLYSPAVL
jgi:hypothetical protein